MSAKPNHQCSPEADLCTAQAFLNCAIPEQKALAALVAAIRGGEAPNLKTSLQVILHKLARAPAPLGDLRRRAARLTRLLRSRARADEIISATEDLAAAWRRARRLGDARAANPATALKPEKPLILIVEDEPIAQMMMRTLLNSIAIILCTDNEDDALQLLQDQRPDLMIVDNQLAGGDSGIALIEKVRAASGGEHLPIVMATASRSEEDTLRALLAGAADYIRKPIDPIEFPKKIDTLLQARSKTVLIADPDPVSRGILARRFHEAGVRVVETAGCAETLAEARAQRPALIIAERIMPHGDGLSLLDVFAADPDLKAIPVIFLTARRDDAGILESLSAGAAEHLVKPFNRDIVYARCERFLKGEGE